MINAFYYLLQLFDPATFPLTIPIASILVLSILFNLLFARSSYR